MAHSHLFRYVIGTGCVLSALQETRMVFVYLGSVRSKVIGPVFSLNFATMSLRRTIGSLYYAGLCFLCKDWVTLFLLCVVFWCCRWLAAGRVRAFWFEYLAQYLLARQGAIEPEFRKLISDAESIDFQVQDALRKSRQLVTDAHGQQVLRPH